MRLHFKVAGKQAVKLYLTGVTTGHRAFAAATQSQRQRYRRLLHGKIPAQLSLPADYRKARLVKRSLLVGGDDQQSSHRLNAELARISFVSPLNYRKAAALKKQLVKYSNDSSKVINDFFTTHQIVLPSVTTVYLVAGLGEQAEALDNLVVLGDGFPPRVAFAVMLEELLHTLIPQKFIFRFESVVSTTVPVEEVVVGALLHRLLQQLNWPKAVIDSVVFGWRGGARAAAVRKLLKQYTGLP